MYNMYIRKLPGAGMSLYMGHQEKINEKGKTIRYILIRDLSFKDKDSYKYSEPLPFPKSYIKQSTRLWLLFTTVEDNK